MNKAKSGKVIPRGRGMIRFKGETKIDKLNKQALKYIRTIKGSFG